MEGSNFKTLTELSAAGKRTADQITPEPVANHYEDANAMLRELHELRKRRPTETTNPDPVMLEKENRIVTLGEIKSGSNLKTTNSLDALSNTIKLPLEESKGTNENKLSDKKWLYINKLMYYPKDDYRDCMIGFREMLYEDLLKDPRNAKWTLEVAFMTTFGFEFELLDPMLRQQIQLVLANDSGGQNLKPIEREFSGYKNLTLIHPPKNTSGGFPGAFHPKLWLLKFPSMLRVVVSSGNLTTGDWAVWSNGLWFQDFPKKQALKTTEKKDTSGFDFNKDFKQTLEHYVQAIMPSKADYKSLLKYDLNDYEYENIDVVLIPSLPGRFRDQEMNKIGLGKINNVLKQFPCQDPNKANKKIVTYQTSSIGQIDEKYLSEFQASVIPAFKSLKEVGAERAKLKKGRSKDEKQTKLLSKPEKADDDTFSVLDHFKLIYPTKSYVFDSYDGVEAAGCLFLKKDYYESGKVSHQILHQFEGSSNYAYNQGVIPHIKVFVVTDDNNEINDDTVIYFGSHNMSPAAWGRYEKDFSQISVMNSELGILIPPMKGSAARKKYLIENLPFRVPPRKYGTSDIPFMAETLQ